MLTLLKSPELLCPLNPRGYISEFFIKAHSHAWYWYVFFKVGSPWKMFPDSKIAHEFSCSRTKYSFLMKNTAFGVSEYSFVIPEVGRSDKAQRQATLAVRELRCIFQGLTWPDWRGVRNLKLTILNAKVAHCTHVCIIFVNCTLNTSRIA